MSPILIALIAALAPTLAIVVAHFVARRDRAAKAEHIEQKASEIHVLVDGRMTEALDRIDQLERKLGVPPEEKFESGPRE